MKGKPTTIRCETCVTRDCSVFRDLSKEHLKALDKAKTTNSYRPRQIIFYEGNEPYGLYCIKEGKIKIYKMDAEGHQQIVRLAGPGDTLGYRCLLAGEPYTANAETLEEATICFIDRKTFNYILETHPGTAFHVMGILAHDLRRAEDKLTRLVHKSVRERLAEIFLVFKVKYGQKIKDGIKLNISLSREEMAELIGTTQETVIRLLSEFKNDGLIAVKGREITLLDIPALSATANLPD